MHEGELSSAWKVLQHVDDIYRISGVKKSSKPAVPKVAEKTPIKKSNTSRTSRKGRKWTAVENKKMVKLLREDMSFGQIAEQLSRTEISITNRLSKLGYIQWDKETGEYIKIK